MNLDSILNVVFFAVGLAIGLLQLYLAQHQFEIQQREKMDELRKILTDIQQRMAVLEELTSDRTFEVQDKLLGLVTGQQAVTEFTEETTKQVRELVDAELKGSGVHESIQRTKSLEEKLTRVLEQSASSLVEHASSAQFSSHSIRETQILELLIKGMTNLQIAEALGISANTVKVYIANLLRRHGAHSRAELLTKQERPEPPDT